MQELELADSHKKWKPPIISLCVVSLIINPPNCEISLKKNLFAEYQVTKCIYTINTNIGLSFVF
jgi:hypothetical protein